MKNSLRREPDAYLGRGGGGGGAGGGLGTRLTPDVTQHRPGPQGMLRSTNEAAARSRAQSVPGSRFRTSAGLGVIIPVSARYCRARSALIGLPFQVIDPSGATPIQFETRRPKFFDAAVPAAMGAHFPETWQIRSLLAAFEAAPEAGAGRINAARIVV